MKHYYYHSNSYLAKSTKCRNLNKIMPALRNTIGKIQCCLWLQRVIARHQLLKRRILHLLNKWPKRFKITKTNKRKLPLHTGSFYCPVCSSIFQACHWGKGHTDNSRDGPTAELWLACGPWVQAVADLAPRWGPILWKLDESFRCPRKAELRWKNIFQF